MGPVVLDYETPNLYTIHADDPSRDVPQHSCPLHQLDPLMSPRQAAPVWSL